MSTSLKVQNDISDIKIESIDKQSENHMSYEIIKVTETGFINAAKSGIRLFK